MFIHNTPCFMKNILKASLAILMGTALLTITSCRKNENDKKKSSLSLAEKAKFTNKGFIHGSMFLLFLN